MNKPIHILIFIFFLVFGFVFSPDMSWSQSNLKPLSTGPWHGAVRGDEQGRATSCYLIAQKTNREFWILLRYDLTGLHLILFNKNWSIKANERYQGRIVIDNLFDSMVPINTPKTTAIDIELGNDEPTLESFQSGRSIKIFTRSGRKKFKLEGTRKAINVLLDCADKYLSSEKSNTVTAGFKPDYARGVKAYKEKNYTAALREWQPLADTGMARAQNFLGILYFYGYGVPKDLTQSFSWFLKAAKQGNRRAENNLGVLYRDGLGVPKNESKAIKWFRKAAAHGHKGAKKRLAKLLGRSNSKSSKTSGSSVLAFLKVLPISQGRNVLYPGDKIRIGFTAPKGQDEYSWIGFVHDNAEADPTPQHFAQQIMKGRTVGVITMEVPAMLGNYRVWMYDRSNRKVLADLPVRIEVDTASARLELPGGTRLKPGESFDVTFKASPNYSSYTWVKIVGLDTPEDIEEKNIPEVEYLGHIRLNGKTSGTLSFTAPKKPGRYLLRMQDPGFIKTLTQLEFSVADPAAVAQARPIPVEAKMPQPAVPAGPKIVPTRPAFQPGKGVEVQFSGLPARSQDWLAIAGEGQGPKQYYDFVMLKDRPVSGSHRFKPLPEGKYIVRLYTNWPDGGYNIVTSVAVNVTSQPVSPQPAEPVTAMPAPAVAANKPVSAFRENTIKNSNQPGKRAKGVAGIWTVVEGDFKTIELDQVMGLVEGKMGGPNGRFEGEFTSGRLTGLWATKDATVGKTCAIQRLGASNWGSIVAELSPDGNTISGSRGNCSQPSVDSFKAIRKSNPAAIKTASPANKISSSTEKPSPNAQSKKTNVNGPVVSKMVCNTNWPTSANGCDRLKIDQIVKAGRDGQYKVSCKAGRRGWLNNARLLEHCTLASALEIKIQELDQTSVVCSAGAIWFDKNGLKNCNDAILKNNLHEYRCDNFKILRSKNDKTSQLVVHQIECTAKSDKSKFVKVSVSFGSLQCKKISLSNQLSVKHCQSASVTSLVFHRDGEKYLCPANAGFSFEPDGKLRFPDGNCRSDGSQIKARLVKQGMVEPLCGEWKYSGTCMEKDIIDELSLRPGDDTKIICEGRYKIRTDGSVRSCKLAAPTLIPVPGPDGDKANCSGTIFTSKAGFVTQCDQEKPSSVRVILPNKLGRAVCKSNKLRFFDDGTLKACELDPPARLQTPKISLTCTGVYFDLKSGKPFIRYCGFSGAGEAQDSDGNSLICNQAREQEIVALNANGGIDIGKYKKERKGYCNAKR